MSSKKLTLSLAQMPPKDSADSNTESDFAPSSEDFNYEKNKPKRMIATAPKSGFYRKRWAAMLPILTIAANLMIKVILSTQMHGQNSSNYREKMFSTLAQWALPRESAPKPPKAESGR
jgi:negative regulator of sigma E activity